MRTLLLSCALIAVACSAAQAKEIKIIGNGFEVIISGETLDGLVVTSDDAAKQPQDGIAVSESKLIGNGVQIASKIIGNGATAGPVEAVASKLIGNGYREPLDPSKPMFVPASATLVVTKQP
jgi:hypothetical protein